MDSPKRRGSWNKWDRLERSRRYDRSYWRRFHNPGFEPTTLAGRFSRIDPSCRIDHAGVHFRPCPVPSPERLRGACAADVERRRLTPVCRGSKCRLHRFGWFSSHTTASQRRSHPFAIISVPTPDHVTRDSSRCIDQGRRQRCSVREGGSLLRPG